MSGPSTYPSKLPKSVRHAETATFFAERRQRADLVAFRKLLKRSGGEPARSGDERAD